MKAFLLGVKDVSFVPRGETEEKKGISLYYSAKSPEVSGMYADNVWIDARKSPDMYHDFKNLDYSKPVAVDMVYEIIPGRKQPMLMEINLL